MTSIDQTTLSERATRVIPGGVNSGQRRIDGLEGLVIASTAGATFTDGEGRTYTDYHAAFGPPLLGHNDPDVDGAVAETARTVGLMGVGVTQTEVDLAERPRRRQGSDVGGDLPRGARRDDRLPLQ